MVKQQVDEHVSRFEQRMTPQAPLRAQPRRQRRVEIVVNQPGHYADRGLPDRKDRLGSLDDAGGRLVKRLADRRVGDGAQPAHHRLAGLATGR
jgi:hypothetical protein